MFRRDEARAGERYITELVRSAPRWRMRMSEPPMVRGTITPLTKGLFLVPALLLLSSFCAPEATACYDFTVRDAAFSEPRNVHRLATIAEIHDPAGQRIHDQLDMWFKKSGAGLNVALLRVAADDPSVRWDEYGIPSAPPSSPVVVLAGTRYAERRAFFIDYWEPGPTSEDLAALKTSPAREAIRREVVHRLAVLLHVPGVPGEAGSTEGVLDRVVRSWADEEPLGVSVVRVDRSDERERLLLSFIGVKESGPDWVAVVFGRGKVMPPLEGENITETRLNELIGLLVDECSCLRPPSSLGVDMPMMWDETLDAAVVALRSSEDIGRALPDAWLGAQIDSSPITRRVLSTTSWTLGAFVLTISFAAAAIVRRGNRKRLP